MRYRYVNLIFIMMIFWPCNLTGSIVKTSVVTLPSSHRIFINLQKQLNGLDCGPASIAMVFEYLGYVDVDQKAIADVARTTSNGTYTWDIVRTGHFSHMSDAQGHFFPNDDPKGGFPGKPLGYASFSHSSVTPWWTELKWLIANDIPVILLMKYAIDDPTGHYRVITGYDEEKGVEGVVYFMDPWDRDLGKIIDSFGMVEWSKADFMEAWNYQQYGAINPYWGAVMMPWSVDLRTTGKTTAGSILKVTAVITYPCPIPFDHSDYPASDVYVEIQVPAGMKVLGKSTINIGRLYAGESVKVSWNVVLVIDGAENTIKVTAGGLISGEVGEAKGKGNGVSYPPYSYTDEIGGEECICL